MASPAPSRVRYRFGPFQLDLDARILLENGKPLHTAAQTLRLLELLVTHAGRLVSRQQLRQELWPDGTFVNFERGINSAVRRLRALLHDSDENSTYIATVTGEGYRFIAPVERLPAAADADAPEPVAAPAPRPPSPARRGLLALAALVLLWALAGLLWPRLRPEPHVVAMHALTTDGGLDLPARPASDGSLLYYLERVGGGWAMVRSDGHPATAQRLPGLFPGRNARLLDVSRSGEWLLGSFRERGEEAALWHRPAAGGSPLRLGDLRALDAVWSPDGQSIYYGFAAALWRARADGSSPQRLAALPADPDWLAWSPDGRRLGFTSADPATGIQALWQWTPAAGARLLPAALPRCCAAWSRDGRYFFFSQQQPDGIFNLWAQPTSSWPARLWPWLDAGPRQLTSQPRSTWGAFTGFGRDLVFYQQEWREDPVSFRPRSRQMQPVLSGRNAIQVVYSRDGRHLVYLDTRDATVWTADVDAQLHATNFRQLSSPGLTAAFPRWSPDGQWIVFGGQTATQPSRLYKVSAAGGPVTPLVVQGAPTGAGLEIPDFSPDGARLSASLSLPGGKAAIAILAGHHLSLLSGSDSFGSAHWSPDGQWLAAASGDQRQIALFNFAQRRWQVVARGHAFTAPIWSAGGDVYFQDLLAPGEPLFRYHPGAAVPQPLAEFSAIIEGGVHRCGFTGLAPDGSLLLSLNRGSADLYAASLDLP